MPGMPRKQTTQACVVCFGSRQHQLVWYAFEADHTSLCGMFECLRVTGSTRIRPVMVVSRPPQPSSGVGKKRRNVGFPIGKQYITLKTPSEGGDFGWRYTYYCNIIDILRFFASAYRRRRGGAPFLKCFRHFKLL